MEAIVNGSDDVNGGTHSRPPFTLGSTSRTAESARALLPLPTLIYDCGPRVRFGEITHPLGLFAWVISATTPDDQKSLGS
jgi:hypothetical protein